MSTGESLLLFLPNHKLGVKLFGAYFQLRNRHPILKFNGTYAVYVTYSAAMPIHYGGNGITLYIHYSVETATSGSIIFETQFERVGDQQQDIDSDGFAPYQTSSATTIPSTSGLVDVMTISHADGSQMDNIVAGDSFRLRMRRRPGLAGDTVNDFVELLAIEMREN